MKEQYQWVEWFNELSLKVSAGGPHWLAERASRVEWRTDNATAPLLRYGEHNVDPFSFIYALAATCGGRPSRTRVVESVTDIFELEAKLPVNSEEAFYFPQGLPQNTLFHGRGEGNPALLWELFRDALRGIETVRSDVFHNVLGIRNVGVAKLTQALFLVDAETFMPYDASTRPLLTGGAPATPDWSRYREAIKELRAAFPGVGLCEINLFAYLRSRGELPSQRVFQVSTNVYGDGVDRWDDFDGNSCVYTGGRAPHTEFEAEVTPGTRTYPLEEPAAGDVVLARYAGYGKALGVVWSNEYRQSITAESRIHVLWLNKTDAPLGFAQQLGFSRAYLIERAFRGREEYQPTFAALDRVGEVDGLNRAAVLGALREFDELGRGQFVERYGRGYGSRNRWIVFEERNYDMKPVWRAAFGHVEGGVALTPDDARYKLHSNNVQEHFEALGFTVVGNADAQPADDGETADTAVVQPVNQILYGPPGTGKTWRTVNLALSIVDEDPFAGHDRERFDALAFNPADGTGNIAMVTFHQNFAYEDFVEGIRPVLGESGGLRYELRAGLFKRIAAAASGRPEERFVLVIDEINRGDIARIFGELITLIETSRRLGHDDATQVTLPYSNKPFGVPGNLYLVGTMNTADRSIQLLDTALRRRFAFVEMMPEPDHPAMARIEGLDCPRLLRTINDRIAVLLDREHQIGHTYLLDLSGIKALGHRFRDQIFPLLQEYFFDDWSKIKAVLGRSPFVVDRDIGAELEGIDMTDEERRIFERLPDDDSAWTSAESYRAIYEGNAPAPSDG